MRVRNVDAKTEVKFGIFWGSMMAKWWWMHRYGLQSGLKSARFTSPIITWYKHSVRNHSNLNKTSLHWSSLTERNDDRREQSEHSQWPRLLNKSVVLWISPSLPLTHLLTSIQRKSLHFCEHWAPKHCSIKTWNSQTRGHDPAGSRLADKRGHERNPRKSPVLFHLFVLEINIEKKYQRLDIMQWNFQHFMFHSAIKWERPMLSGTLFPGLFIILLPRVKERTFPSSPQEVRGPSLLFRWELNKMSHSRVFNSYFYKHHGKTRRTWLK